jgi:hypothetical protein
MQKLENEQHLYINRLQAELQGKDVKIFEMAE